jgi:hypothetical protein
MTATLLQNAKQQFFDSNGRPLAGGSVYFYIPNTSTFKNTWQDEGKTTLNTNPVVLDASGEAIIYGDGQYRQVVNDVHGNLIWDQLTDSPALNSELQTLSTQVQALTAGLAAPSGSSQIGFIQAGSGAVARTAQDKEREIVSVNDFGAVGNGINDDTLKIQAAIDAVSAAGGGKVVLLAGYTYIVSARNVTGIAVGVAGIVLKDNVTLQIDGTLKVKANSYGPGAFYGAIRSLDVGLNNAAIIGSGTVDGNKSNQTASNQCSNIYLVCTFNVRVNGIYSLNPNGMGIQLTSVTGSTHTACAVTNCFVNGSTNIGIQVSHALSCVITNNRITTCTNNGIDVYGENGTVSPDDGIITISDNVVAGTLVGVFVETSTRVSVTGNAVDGSTMGYAVNRVNGAPSLITFSGNTCSTCPTGISITGDTAGVQVNGNTFGFSSVGLQLGGGGGNISYVVATNNLFSPSSTTANLVAIAGNVASFIMVRDNYYNDSSHSTSHLIVNTATTTTGCIFEPIISLTQVYQPVTQVYAGSGSSGGTSTITVPAAWAGGKLVIKATSGGAYFSVWSGSVTTDGTRVTVAQDSTGFTTPGNAISSVAGSATTLVITITWAATGSPITWAAWLEYI